MLAHHEYAALTTLFEDLQAQFESNPANEAWPMDAAESFESGEPTIDADLAAGHTGDRAALDEVNADAAATCPSCFRVRTM